MNTFSATISSDVRMARTYLLAALFVVGNIALPQLVHFIPGGGPMLLPIYFFTLIAAWRYGFTTGLVTALASPLINHLLVGMPSAEMLPVLLSKSVLLASAAGYISYRLRGEVSIKWLIVVVLAYQLPGMLIELGVTGSWTMAFQDIRVGWLGMMVQVVGGYFLIPALRAMINDGASRND